jgi:GNAT superfamily N-acetyltransferase
MPSFAGFSALPTSAAHQHGAIRVVPAAGCDRAALLELGVHPAQRCYVGLIEDLLADDLRCPDSEAMAIVHGETPVGYYRIERKVSVAIGRDLEPPSLGLRAFFIDWRWQRRGFGVLAMRALLADLAIRHPRAAQLALMVNCSNREALALYRRLGFVGTDELYHGGRTGPLWLLTRPLSGRYDLT